MEWSKSLLKVEGGQTSLGTVSRDRREDLKPLFLSGFKRCFCRVFFKTTLSEWNHSERVVLSGRGYTT